MPVEHRRLRQVAPFVLLLWAAPAFAGYYYEATTVTESDDRRGAERTNVKVWVEGDATRVDFAEGDATGNFKPGTWLVSRDAGATMLLVNDQEKTWSEFNLGQMADALGQMGGMVKFEFTDLYSQKISEAPGETLLGHDTSLVVFKSGYTMNMAVMGMKQTQKVEMAQAMWTTDAFDARAFAVWLRPDKRMGGSIPGLSEMMEVQFETMQGVPLKSVVKTRSTDQKGRVTNSVATTTVTSLREEAVPASRFEIPADYRQENIMPDAIGQPRTSGAQQGGAVQSRAAESRATASAPAPAQQAQDPAASQAAQQACLQQKIAEAQEAQKTKRGLGRLMGAVTRTVSRYGGPDLSGTVSDIYGANATAEDLAAAARDLGLTEDQVAACRNAQ